jgi:hypothetical protein
MSAGSVAAARLAPQRGGGGSIPTPALQDLVLRPIAKRVAATLVQRHHYLHSAPGGTHLAFGIFVHDRLRGCLVLGVGPKHGHRLVEGAGPDDCLTLSRLWLADELPPNSESRVLAITARLLKKHTSVQFLLSYADPAAGHVGTIYMASNWLYTGVSEGTPLYDIGDGVARHSRTLSFNLGSHSLRYLREQGVPVSVIPQSPKHRYLLPLRPGVRERLTVPVLPFPKEKPYGHR